MISYCESIKRVKLGKWSALDWQNFKYQDDT